MYTKILYKNSKVITNKSKCTYDMQKEQKTHAKRNKSIKPFSRTDQVLSKLERF